MTAAQEFIMATYEEIKELSCTNISQVVLVRSSLDKKYYIRRILPKDCRAVYRMLKEKQIAGTPMIADIIYDERTIVFEEYIQGKSLEEQAMRELKGENFVAYMLDLLEILQNIHACGIVHRDIKEENILVRPDNTLVLIDFAIAKLTVSEQLCGEPDRLGTLGYAAPEQFVGNQADIRSDLYSFGKVCKKLLDKCNNISQAQRELWEMIAKRCVEFESRKRYQNVGEILEIIRQPAFYYGSPEEHLIEFAHMESPPCVRLAEKEEKTVLRYYGFDTIRIWENMGNVMMSFSGEHASFHKLVFEAEPELPSELMQEVEIFFLKNSLLAVRAFSVRNPFMNARWRKIVHRVQVRQVTPLEVENVRLSELYDNLTGYCVLGDEELLMDKDTLNTFRL